MILAMYALPVSTPRVKSTERIGPHCSAVISILIGSLLGDGTMERGACCWRLALLG